MCDVPDVGARVWVETKLDRDEQEVWREGYIARVGLDDQGHHATTIEVRHVAGDVTWTVPGAEGEDALKLADEGKEWVRATPAPLYCAGPGALVPPWCELRAVEILKGDKAHRAMRPRRALPERAWYEQLRPRLTGPKPAEGGEDSEDGAENRFAGMTRGELERRVRSALKKKIKRNHNYHRGSEKLNLLLE